MDRTPMPCLHPQAGHVHGTRLAYSLDGCRCYPCCNAVSVYNQRLKQLRAYGQPTVDGWVDAGPARAHVQALQAAGLGHKRVAGLAGVNPSNVGKLLYGRTRNGRKEPPLKRIQQVTADALLAVPMPALEDLGGALPVDGTGTRRRLQALCAIGWSANRLAPMLGITPANMPPFMRAERVLVRHALAVRALYDQLSFAEPPADNYQQRQGILRVQKRAAALGWAAPLAWDDDTIDDPAARPDRGVARGDAAVFDEVAVQRSLSGDHAVRLRVHERRAVILALVEAGLNDQQIEARTGISDRTVLRVRHAEHTAPDADQEQGADQAV